MRVHTAAAVAAACAATAALPLAGAVGAQSGSFTLESRLDARSMRHVDVRPKGNTPGDLYVFATTLRRNGAVAGRAEYVQTLIDKRYRGVSMRVDLVLSDGSLALQGAGLERRPPGVARETNDADFAVVGGTGAYAGANGTVHVVDTGRNRQRLEVHLEG